MLYWLQILKKSNSFGIIIILSILISIMGLLSPIFIIHIFNRYITFGLEGTLYFLVFGALTVSLFEFFFRNLRNQIFGRITKQPIKISKFEILNRFFNSESVSKEKLIDSLDINNNFHKFLSSQNQSNLIDSFFLIFILIFLFFLNIKLSLIFLFILFSYLLFQKQNNLKKSAKSERNKISGNDRQIITDLANNIDLIKYLNAKKYTSYLFEKYHDKKNINDNMISELDNLNLSYNNFIIIFCSIIIIGFGSTLVVSGNITIGALIGFNIFSSRALIIASSAQRSYFIMSLINTYISNLNQILTTTSTKSEKLKLSKVNGELEIKNLDFSHEKNNLYLIKNLTFKVNPGNILNISGDNGTGKTTLAKIILGLHKPNGGEIYIDGTNVQKLSLQWWREQVAYVPQNPEILGSSMNDNILLVNEKLNQQEISRLLHTVGLGDNLKKSNLSFTDNVEKNLSKGFKKKIHFARMLAMNCQIYLLDDPLSEMDKNGKVMVSKFLLSLKKSNKTIVTFSNSAMIEEIADTNLNLNGI